MYSPFGHVLKEEPTELAPRWDVVPPHRSAFPEPLPGCTDISVIAALPAPVLITSSRHHTMDRTWVGFCPGWRCPGHLEHYFAALLFAETRLLAALAWSSCWCPDALLDPGTARVCISLHHHLTVSMIPPPEPQILRSCITFLPMLLQLLHVRLKL